MSDLSFDVLLDSLGRLNVCHPEVDIERVTFSIHSLKVGEELGAKEKKALSHFLRFVILEKNIFSDAEMVHANLLLSRIESGAGSRMVPPLTLQKKSNWPKLFEPLHVMEMPETNWSRYHDIAESSLFNVAMLPLGVVDHVLASVLMDEMSWEESWEEVWQVGGMSAIVGGTWMGASSGLQGLAKLAEDNKLAGLLRSVSRQASPRVRAYLVPILFFTAFTFIALRESQKMPVESGAEYRWNFLKEIAGSFGVQFVVSGGVFFLTNRLLSAMGHKVAGKPGAGAILGTAMMVGMFAGEVYASWYRRDTRQRLKEETCARIVHIMKKLESVPPGMRDVLYLEVDRAFAQLVAYNVLEFPSLQAALSYSEEKQNRADFAASNPLGMSGEPFWSEATESLTPEEEGIWQKWMQRIGGKETKANLPVGMLPVQKRRILSLWEGDLAQVRHLLVMPPNIIYGFDAHGKAPTEQFAEWGLGETFALMRKYISLRETLQKDLEAKISQSRTAETEMSPSERGGGSDSPLEKGAPEDLHVEGMFVP